MTVHKVQI